MRTRSKRRAKHVVARHHCSRTRVQLPPPPPNCHPVASPPSAEERAAAEQADDYLLGLTGFGTPANSVSSFQPRLAQPVGELAHLTIHDATTWDRGQIGGGNDPFSVCD